MNKNLISLNPVLRFKQGKLILKFLNPSGALGLGMLKGAIPINRDKKPINKTPKILVIPDKDGDWHYHEAYGLRNASWRRKNTRTGKTETISSDWANRGKGAYRKDYKTSSGYTIHADNAGYTAPYTNITKRKNGLIWGVKDGKTYDVSTGKLVNSGTILDKNSGKKYKLVNGVRLEVTTPVVETENSNSTSASTPSKTFSVTPRSGWSYGYDRSGEIADIKAALDMLRAGGFYAKGENSKSDGAWGKATEAAYQRYLASKTPLNLTPEVLLEKPAVNLYPEEVKLLVNNAMNLTQIDPYRAYNNYSGLALKNLGFNNYNTMVNYVLNNPQNQFSKDLTKRFGDVNTWNQADIEQNLGVYGNYRGSRTGDFGDIARSMSTWAGNFNGTLDGKVDLASRTGSDGIVYSNSRVRDLFDRAGKSLLSKNPVTRFKKGGFVNFRVAVQ